ncbi:MAG TPA: transcriptional repressor [Syntrophomonas sp.]|nr:transcriptional repressor [Syntrophomonas sp.]
MQEIHTDNLNGRTVRNSKQRQAILDMLSRQQSHLSAEEIYQAVKVQHPKISLGTVYRNLEVLTETGQIDRTSFADGKARFELSLAGHHHHLVCMKCGDIENIITCPMAREITGIIESHDFRPMHHYFEIYGYCHKCQ